MSLLRSVRGLPSSACQPAPLLGLRLAVALGAPGLALAAAPPPVPPPAVVAASPVPAIAPLPPPPQSSFESLLASAVPGRDLETLIEPLYARCDLQDELGQRQCEGTRAFLLDYLKQHSFVADADVVPDTTPYDATAKQVDIEIPGCLFCTTPPQIAGQSRYLTMRPPQHITNGKVVVTPVASHEVHLPDRVAADRFVERVVPRLRVQHVFRVESPFGDAPPIAPVSASSAAVPAAPLVRGVLVTSLGHRVYDRCTGEVYAAAPPASGTVKVTPDATCPQKGAQEFSLAELKKQAEIAALPERLTPRQIDQVLAPVQASVHDCYVEFGEPSGLAKVNLMIGGEGKLTQIALSPPFDKADIGICIRSQLKSTVFPRFKGTAMTVDYVYQVQ